MTHSLESVVLMADSLMAYFIGETSGYSDNPDTVTVSWFPKGASFTENHQICRVTILTVTIFRFPSIVTVTVLLPSEAIAKHGICHLN